MHIATHAAKAQLKTPAVKGTAVQKERELIGRVIGASTLLSTPHLSSVWQQSGQQTLLRAARYSHWFTQVGKSTNAATLRRHAKNARRCSGQHCAFFSFAIKTAMRRGEVCKLRWQHVKFADGDILLPGAMTRNRKDRIVALALRAQRILATTPRTAEHVVRTTTDAIKTAVRRARERSRSAT